MEMKLDFNYNGTSTIIQGNSQDKIKDLISKYTSKTEVNTNSLYFLYGGKTLKEDSTLEQIMSNEDKKRKKMNILINKQEYEYEENIPKYFYPLNIICSKCGENAKINFTEYKLLSQCKNGHCIGNILLHENKEKQKIDLSKIICHICKENNKGNTYKNNFYRCNHCHINICPLCKEKHEKNHNIINYDDKDYVCEKHNEKMSSYCEQCEKNICIYCKEHDKHKLINFKDIIPDLNEESNKIKKLKDIINKAIIKIDGILDRIKLVKENFEYYYKLNENIMIHLNERNVNYEILYNFNNINNSELENAINNVIKTNDVNEIFKRLNELYQKMTNKFQETLTIKYLTKNNPTIRIFGSEFVKNNKNLCSIIIINNKEQDLKETITFKYQEKEKSILEVTLKGIQNLTNISHMFSGCSALNYLPDIGKWNTINITDMSYLFYKCSLNKNDFDGIKEWNTQNVKNMNNMFSECRDMITLPNISCWNTTNLESMNNIFAGCINLNSIPDISKWNTMKIQEMASLFQECSSLEYLPPISEWNTNKVKKMTKLFSGCKNLKNLPDISKWNVCEKTCIEDISGMFSGCSSLIILPDISNWSTYKVVNMSYLFQNCSSLCRLPKIS